MSRKSKKALNNPEVSTMKKSSEPIRLRMQRAAIFRSLNMCRTGDHSQKVHNTAQTYSIQLS